MWRGTWSSAITYNAGDAVEYLGSSYVAVASSTAISPPSIEWEVLAANGAQGDSGPPGIQGPPGPAGPRGPKGLVWRGNWSGVETYGVDDAVECGGASYVAVAASTAIAPPSIEWTLLAAAGAPGQAGPQGPPGVVSAKLPLVYDATLSAIASMPADATHDGHVTTGTQTFGGVKVAAGFIASDILGCADVRAFGADPGRSVDANTVAVQAAINAAPGSGGPVCFPPGAFALGPLVMRPATRVIGSGSGDVEHGLWSSGATLLDFSNIGPSTALAWTAGHPSIEHVALVGPDPDPGIEFESIAILLGGTSGAFISDVSVARFARGIVVAGNNTVIINARTRHQGAVGLDIKGHYVTVLGGYFSDAIRTGADGANVRISDESHDVAIIGAFVDEAFGVAPASIRILGADRVKIQDTRVFTSPQGGYGIQLGNGVNNPTNVVIDNVRIEPFDVNELAGLFALEIRGSRHTLRAVSTAPFASGGGGGVNDLAADTAFFDVNGVTRLPKLPSSDPGAGSKQFWYDPAAGNVVKYSP